MPRLIDADKVREHKYKSVQYEKAIVNELPDDPPFAFMCGWNEALDSVYQYAPTVDAEPVVRCKDCKHFSFWCELHETRVDPEEDYCSWAEGYKRCPYCGAKMDETEERLVMPKADGSTIKIGKMDEVGDV